MHANDCFALVKMLDSPLTQARAQVNLRCIRAVFHDEPEAADHGDPHYIIPLLDFNRCDSMPRFDRADSPA